jgi:hypothetical protein
MHQLYLIFEKKWKKNWWALRRCKHISRGHLLQKFFQISDGIIMSEFLNNSDQRNQMAFGILSKFLFIFFILQLLNLELDCSGNPRNFIPTTKEADGFSYC